MEYLVFLLLTGVLAADDLYGKAGSNVTLSCDVRRGVNPFSWNYVYPNGSRTMYSSDAIINTVTLPSELYNRLGVKVNQATGEYNLLVTDIRSSDEGKYECNANVDYVLQTDSLNLYLVTPPTVINISNVENNRLVGKEGHDLVISCTANGKPAPNVTLKLDGNILSSGKSNVQHKFIKIERNRDLKNITCQAINDPIDTPVSVAAKIYLNLKPLQPTFSSQQIITDENIPLVISCTSLGSRPAALFLWMIGQVNVTTSSQITQSTVQADETYHVTSQLQSSVDRSYDGQPVTCRAVNIAGDNSTNGVLEIKYPPDITVTNETYNQNDIFRTLTCTAVGNPPQYTYSKWKHKSRYGELIRELDGGQDGVLTLPSGTIIDRYQDSGVYVCTASNGIKDKNGNAQQTGSGYAVIYAQPIFTRNNINAQYGEIERTVDINAYVYSVPKFTTIQWYKGNTLISPPGRYGVYDTAAVVYDTFHGKDVHLDGYRITLRITNLEVSDFNISYRVVLANSVGSAVEYSVLLESASAPQSPSNVSVVSYSTDSLVVQWIPGYNGGHDQTFVIEYRTLGADIWVPHQVPNTQQSGLQVYILQGLQSGTIYELRMYAVNKFNRSLSTDMAAVARTSPMEKETSSFGPIIGGIVGGLIAIVLVTVTVVILFKRIKGSSSHQSENSAFYQNKDNRQKIKSRKNDTEKRTAQMTPTENYETLGSRDTPNTYDLVENNSDQSNKPDIYELLGKKDQPNTYDVISHGKGKGMDWAIKEKCRVVDNKDETNYENIGDRKDFNQVYINLKI